MGQTDESAGIVAWGSLHWEWSGLGAPEMDPGARRSQSQASQRVNWAGRGIALLKEEGRAFLGEGPACGKGPI